MRLTIVDDGRVQERSYGNETELYERMFEYRSCLLTWDESRSGDMTLTVNEHWPKQENVPVLANDVGVMASEVVIGPDDFAPVGKAIACASAEYKTLMTEGNDMGKKYLVISANEDGEVHGETVRADELTERLNDEYYGEPKILSSIPRESDMTNWGPALLILELNIMVPQARQVVKEYVLEGNE